MYKVLGIVFFVVGLVQFAAIVTGFQHALGAFGIVLAFIVGEIPIVGTILGISGAINVWGWGLLPSLALFLGIPGVMLLVTLASSRRS